MARILILDDDLASLAVARRAVRAAGHDAVAVTSAADAVEALDSRHPPEVLLAAPSADSGEALALVERVRSDPARSATAVLLIGEGGPAALPALAPPLDGPGVGARIAEALATRATAAERRVPAAAAPSPTPRWHPAGTAEAALRALFRRPAAPASAPPPPPGASAAGSPASPAPRDGEAVPVRVPLPGPPPRPPPPVAGGAGPGARLAGSEPQQRAAPPTRELVALARSADYFTVLGVARDATATEIRDSAGHLLGELEVRRLAQEGMDEAEFRDVRRVVLDARDVLSDADLRGAYARAIDDVAEPPRS